MTISSQTSGGVVIDWRAEQRDGHCPECNCLLEEPTAEDKKEWRETGKLLRLCPDCGERKLGRLICRFAKLEPPTIECLRFSCLWRYPKKAFAYALLMHYERLRITYCQSHRHNQIPEHYRTGEKYPSTIPRTFWELIKIRTRR